MSRATLFIARLSILAASVAVLVGAISPSRAEDAASEFAALSNTAGAPSTYGWKPLRLTADVRSRLAEAARDSTLEPWQRSLMLEVARGRPTGTAIQPSAAIPGVALPPAGIVADDGIWIEVPPAGSPPSGRFRHTAIYDPVRDRMVVFGGYDNGISFYNDVWALSLAGSPAWSALAPAGTPPAARLDHSAIYDPVRDRMVVFGGHGDVIHFYNDVWALTLSGSPSWSALAPAGSPPAARYEHTAIYDPLRDRMVVFGGFSAGGYLNDVWAFTLAGTPAWSALAPAGTPPSVRSDLMAIFDPVRDRMVVFGGGGNALYNDVGALSLAGSPAWSALSPAGSPPIARYDHTAIYDPVRDRMVVFGGHNGFGFQNDVWALSLAGSLAWSELAPAGSPPSARYEHTAFYDPLRDRMVVFGGHAPNHNDVWALGWAPPVSVPGDALSRRFELAPPRPNPSRGETAVDFELGEPARVVLDVFDTRGRRVKRIADGWLPAGHHATTWRGDDDRGHALVSGVYFVRIQVGGFQATRRMVRVR